VVQHLPAGYVFDPTDPRAPTHQQWEAMTPAERARVLDMLPTSLPIEVQPPGGDARRVAKQGLLSALGGFLRRMGRKIYLSSELLVLYPGERGFCPDVLAVLDVEPDERTRWVTSHEGKGLDLVIEVHVGGDRAKDEEENVERYARLGVREYFFFDRPRARLHGHRLAPGARAYQRLVPQAGFFASEVLGLDLAVQGQRLRFFQGNVPLEDADERIARLGAMLDDVIAHKEEAERRSEEAQRTAADLAAKLEDERRHREDAERRLAEAEAEIARLKQQR
jgi:Uma2 family endonuclease